MTGNSVVSPMASETPASSRHRSTSHGLVSSALKKMRNALVMNVACLDLQQAFALPACSRGKRAGQTRAVLLGARSSAGMTSGKTELSH
jgi:hypothetical protein